MQSSFVEVRVYVFDNVRKHVDYNVRKHVDYVVVRDRCFRLEYRPIYMYDFVWMFSLNNDKLCHSDLAGSKCGS